METASDAAPLPSLPLSERLGYTIEEAALLVGATKNQIRDAVTERRIRHSRPFGARDVRITREHLLDFLERNEVEPQQ